MLVHCVGFVLSLCVFISESSYIWHFVPVFWHVISESCHVVYYVHGVCLFQSTDCQCSVCTSVLSCGVMFFFSVVVCVHFSAVM